MKVAIYGCGNWAKIMLPFFEKKSIALSYFIQTQKEMDEFCGHIVKPVCDVKFDEIDYLVISSNIYYREMYDELTKLSGFNENNMFKIKSFSSFLDLFIDKDADYRTVTVKGNLSYVFSNEDTVIGPMMTYSGINHGADIMEDVFALARENPNFKKDGIFLDIGANIGTASIYAKHLNSKFKVVAFEPGRKNFNLLKCNCILNGMSDIRVENVGLGKEDGIVLFQYDSKNPGGSHVSKQGGEYIKMTSLDNFCTKNNISHSDVSFIWMDTEGFEDEVIIGGRETVWQKRITDGVPFIQEFNPDSYIKKENMELYCKILKDSYSFFVDARKDKNEIKKIPVERLEQFSKEIKRQTDLFFF